MFLVLVINIISLEFREDLYSLKITKHDDILQNYQNIYSNILCYVGMYFTKKMLYAFIKKKTIT